MNQTAYPHSDSIVSVKTTAVVVPFNRPPVVATGRIEDVALLLIDIETSGGVIGRSYLFAFSSSMLKAIAASVESLAQIVAGHTLAPLTNHATLINRLRLIDTPGLIGLALSGIDMALWDAHAKVLKQPLARVLGSSKREIPAYNSCGLWIEEPESLADQANQLLNDGQFNAIKLRLGRSNADIDLQAVRSVRKKIPSTASLMADLIRV